MNICIKCVYWSKCLTRRYNGAIPKGVTDYEKAVLDDNREVLYIKECENFKKFKPFTGKFL